MTENYFAGEHALAEGTEEQDFVTVLPCVVHRCVCVVCVVCGAQVLQDLIFS